MRVFWGVGMCIFQINPNKGCPCTDLFSIADMSRHTVDLCLRTQRIKCVYVTQYAVVGPKKTQHSTHLYSTETETNTSANWWEPINCEICAKVIFRNNNHRDETNIRLRLYSHFVRFIAPCCCDKQVWSFRVLFTLSPILPQLSDKSCTILVTSLCQLYECQVFHSYTHMHLRKLPNRANFQIGK